MRTRTELIAAHGTLADFRRAVWAAWEDGTITYDEAMKVVIEYKAELEGAA